MTPRFSIILPTYNRASFIQKTISSVLLQKFKNWELIIIDDGSTDNTREIIGQYNDTRIQYIYQENAERSVARNNGIKNANGNYICFLDSDDYYLPNHLADLDQFLISHSNPIGLINFGCYLEKNNNKKIFNVKPITNNNQIEYFFTNPTPPIRVCLHNSILQKYNFDEDILITEDTCLWMKVVNSFPVFTSNHLGVVYNVHDENSVNRKKPGALKTYSGLKVFFKRNSDIKKAIHPKVYASWISQLMTNIAIYYIINNQSLKAVFWVFRAFITSPIHIHTRFRIVLLLYIFKIKKTPYFL